MVLFVIFKNKCYSENRHCERSAAIYFKNGLPRRWAPRNDDGINIYGNNKKIPTPRFWLCACGNFYFLLGHNFYLHKGAAHRFFGTGDLVFAVCGGLPWLVDNQAKAHEN